MHKALASVKRVRPMQWVMIAVAIAVIAFLFLGMKKFMKLLGIAPTKDDKTHVDGDNGPADVVLSMRPVDYGRTNLGSQTLTQTGAKSLADQLWEAMVYPGTAEDTVVKISKRLNDEGMRAVFKEFGTRTKGFWPVSENLNLYGWFSSEFSGDDKAELIAAWAKCDPPYNG